MKLSLLLFALLEWFEYNALWFGGFVLVDLGNASRTGLFGIQAALWATHLALISWFRMMVFCLRFLPANTPFSSCSFFSGGWSSFGQEKSQQRLFRGTPFDSYTPRKTDLPNRKANLWNHTIKIQPISQYKSPSQQPRRHPRSGPAELNWPWSPCPPCPPWPPCSWPLNWLGAPVWEIDSC